MRFVRVRSLGRYRHKESGREANVSTGDKEGTGIGVIFYLYRGKRHVLSDREFFGDWQPVAA